MTPILVLIAVAFAAWWFAKEKSSRFPQRLDALRRSLQLHAQARQATDPFGADDLNRLASDLQEAVSLCNDSVDAVHARWSALRPQLLHLTSEDILNRVDLFYIPEREEYKAAIFNVVATLDKKEQAALKRPA
jgi:hypothetical protein